MAEKIVVYGHPGCPGVPPVRGMLNSAHIEFEYINIHQDEAAAAKVREINKGNESVPTLVFPDGSTLTEPSGLALQRKLASMGYKIGVWGFVVGNMWLIFMALAIILAVLRALHLF